MSVLSQGHELWLLTRGQKPAFRILADAHLLTGDIDHLSADLRRELQRTEWDCVVDWVTFRPDQAHARIALFREVAAQFIFISTAGVYPSSVKMPIREQDTVGQLVWPYAQEKALCESVFLQAFHETGFPITIIRPAHTYCEFTIPTNIQGLGYGLVERIKNKKPILVHDQGQSLWTMTHSEDFAVGLTGLLGRRDAMGECFHITQEQRLTWMEIFHTFTKLLNISPGFVFVPSTSFAAYDQNLYLFEDKGRDMIFSNEKIMKFVPHYRPSIDFETGLGKALEWYARHPEWIFFDRNKVDLVDRIILDYQGK